VDECKPLVLGGGSALALLPTGAGKSLTYQLTALLLPGRAAPSPQPVCLLIVYQCARTSTH